MSEVRVTDPNTGGQKGTKPERFDLLPPGPLAEVARHYGKGAEKYEDHNWRKGYKFSLSYAALQRHAWAFWNGEDVDPETGTSHLAAVVFHAFSMMNNLVEHPEMDDRYRGQAEPGGSIHVPAITTDDVRRAMEALPFDVFTDKERLNLP